MRHHHLLRATIVASAAVLMLAAASARAQDISLDGTFTLSPVGDLTVVLKLTLPMEKYQGLRNSVSNLYLFTRGLASARASTEVAERKAEWDDSARALTFTMRMLGAARNLGNHWEVDIAKGTVFSNLDEDKKAVYFSETAPTDSGTIRGNDRLFLPPQATQAKYDDSRKVVTYVMPKPSSGGSKGLLLVPGIVLLVLGLGAFGASFAVGRKTGAPPQV
jgi:hypothetical protein